MNFHQGDAVKPFPKEKLDAIKRQIDETLKKTDPQSAVAAFDADGTLWACDMGEGLFKYQIQHKLVDLPENPWEYYLKMHDEDAARAFLWLAQINAGQRIETVREWAARSVRSLEPVPIFSDVKEIIHHLQTAGVKTYVVTASVKWAVEPAASLVGIPKENVIGIKTKVVNGVVTDEQDGPITWREGKVTGLLEQTKGQRPIFAAGNTKGDLPLLESSTGLRMVLASAPKGHVNFSTEQEMLKLAQLYGWHSHSYI